LLAVSIHAGWQNGPRPKALDLFRPFDRVDAGADGAARIMTSKPDGMSAFLAVSMAMVILSLPNCLVAWRTRSVVAAVFIETWNAQASNSSMAQHC
jgi:hypothetical protein